MWDHQNNNQVVVLPEGENPRGIEKRLVRTVLWLTIMIMVVIMMVVVVMVVVVTVMVMIECSRCVQWFGDQWAWTEGNLWRRETLTGSWTWTGHGEDFFVVGDVDCDVFDDRDDADDHEPLEEGDTHRIMDMDKLCFLAQIHYYCFGIEIGQDWPFWWAEWPASGCVVFRFFVKCFSWGFVVLYFLI